MNAALASVRRVAALCVAILLTGCATSAVEHFYTVSAPGGARATAEDQAPRVAVAPVAIPAMIDRPQLVQRTSSHEVSVLENHRWAEPLSTDLTRALVDELRRSTTGVEIIERGAPQARGASAVLEVTIAELVTGPDSTTALRASWQLRDRERACVMAAHIDVQIPTQAGYDAIPAAYAVAMTRLAEPVAHTIEQSMSCTEAEASASAAKHRRATTTAQADAERRVEQR